MIINAVFATLVIVVMWFLIFVCLHIVGVRSGRDNAQWLTRSYAACYAATLLSVAALSMWRDFGRTMVLSLVIAGLTSACLFILYVPALYTVLTSHSVATLVLLRRSGGQLPEASLYERFATRGIMQQRLSVLVGAGYLVENARGFSLTRRGRGLVRPFALVKKMWRLGPGG
jgi:hypothetical protein